MKAREIRDFIKASEQLSKAKGFIYAGGECSMEKVYAEVEELENLARLGKAVKLYIKKYPDTYIDPDKLLAFSEEQEKDNEK